MRNTTDAMNNERVKTSLENLYLSIYLQGPKGLCGVLLWEGVGDWTELQYIDPHSYGRQRCVFLVLLMLNWRPRGPLCWVRAFSTTSCHQQVSLHHRGSRGPLRLGVAFPTTSYQQLLWTPTQSGAPRAPSTWRGFPYHISSITPTGWLLSWLSYIILQRPLNRLLDLWNGMLDRHQAEITVMQFTGHSLPVHQSMGLPWEF